MKSSKQESRKYLKSNQPVAPQPQSLTDRTNFSVPIVASLVAQKNNFTTIDAITIPNFKKSSKKTKGVLNVKHVLKNIHA